MSNEHLIPSDESEQRRRRKLSRESAFVVLFQIGLGFSAAFLKVRCWDQYFFLIFINDLDYGIKNWILKFADDTKIFGKINTAEDHINLQRGLDKLVRWSEEWQMVFNVGKCKVMHFGRSNPSNDYTT